ncbi:sugar dehydrogenase complex small subunit [Caballeronia sp. LZ062]|uniref:sugar dehydrogenase complex small subunit n=1 Tax=unclassified Caballeronia TaxID=2646786 RepID=UPI00285F5E53|nr:MULTISPECIES: sugar dehydrogenase complex small subunit [unclassified Caballeronia]MDR5856938.1 sugar dehydrogenase complex small subunit [Caballeronia sp. LZ050]MDR5869665.1 sugar dehydrogenase complex small subunit [Caballeronia sp. LZ062]
MAERKRVSFAMRRAMLAGAGASAAIAFAPSRAASADEAAFDTFIAVSMKLTGRAGFDPLVAERVHAALARAEAGFDAKMQRLDHWLSTHGGTPSDVVTAALRATQPDLAKAVGSVMRAWYLGVAGEGEQAEVVAFERALMFDPVRDMLTVPSYCRGEPADWAKKP